MQLPSSFLSKLRSSTVSRASAGSTAREQRALEASWRSSGSAAASFAETYDADELEAMNEAHGADEGSDEGIVLSDETGRVDFLTSLPSELVRRLPIGELDADLRRPSTSCCTPT